MRRAVIVYWFAGADLRTDGGGMRAMGWRTALTELGFDATIVPLRVLGANGGHASVLSRVKRTVIPMPFEQELPDVGSADLVVATVPAVFRSAVRKVPRRSLVFDWMDRWSANSLNLGAATPFSAPGGRFQSRLWSRREKSLPSQAIANSFAGYEDYADMGDMTSERDAWIPNPLPFVEPVHHSSTSHIRRVGFIGSLNYPPNEISLRHFFKRFAPELARSGIEVIVAGYGSERVREWGVEATVIGQVADPAELYAQVDAAIVPIEHGGGIKVKAIEALSYGVPVFATDHVRAGFGPEFRPWILDMASLFQPGIELPDPISRQQYDAHFSQGAFTASVERMLGA